MGKKLFKKKEWDLKTFDGDILLNERADRRVLPDVPDPEGIRSQFDRRGVSADNDSVESVILNRKSGIRFVAGFPVEVSFRDMAGEEDHFGGHRRYIGNGYIAPFPGSCKRGTLKKRTWDAAEI